MAAQCDCADDWSNDFADQPYRCDIVEPLNYYCVELRTTFLLLSGERPPIVTRKFEQIEVEFLPDNGKPGQELDGESESRWQHITDADGQQYGPDNFDHLVSFDRRPAINF